VPSPPAWSGVWRTLVWGTPAKHPGAREGHDVTSVVELKRIEADIPLTAEDAAPGADVRAAR
jgi:hypothetical protein